MKWTRLIGPSLRGESDLLGEPEVTAKLYCNFAYLYWVRLRDLQYTYAVTSGSPSKSLFCTAVYLVLGVYRKLVEMVSTLTNQNKA